jgi:hypothetical protein
MEPTAYGSDDQGIARLAAELRKAAMEPTAYGSDDGRHDGRYAFTSLCPFEF